MIVGTRDNPLYTADLASKPTSSGPASLFSSSSNSSTSSNTPNNRSLDSPTTPSSGSGGLFGFGGALGALAGGLSSSSGGGAGSNQRNLSAASGTPNNSAGQAEGKGIGFGRYNDKHVLQMIAHSSLDVVEDKQFANGAMYMKAIDRINEWTTSAFLVPGSK